jgi:hypothetical protein
MCLPLKLRWRWGRCYPGYDGSISSASLIFFLPKLQTAPALSPKDMTSFKVLKATEADVVSGCTWNSIGADGIVFCPGSFFGFHAN